MAISHVQKVVAMHKGFVKIIDVSSYCYGSNLIKTFNHDTPFLSALDACRSRTDCDYLYANESGFVMLCHGIGFLTSSKDGEGTLFIKEDFFPTYEGYDRLIGVHNDVRLCRSDDLKGFYDKDPRHMSDHCTAESLPGLKINLFDRHDRELHDRWVHGMTSPHSYEECRGGIRTKSGIHDRTDMKSLSVVYMAQKERSGSGTPSSEKARRQEMPIGSHYHEEGGSVVGDDYFNYAPKRTVWGLDDLKALKA